MSAHAPLMPSAAGRWIRCPASVTMEARYPEDGDSDKARAGTAAHWAASERLQGRDVALGQVADNGVVLDDEMIEAVDLYCKTVGALLAIDDRHPTAITCVEQRVAIPYVHAECWGTPDFFAYLPTQGELHVVDYKHGHGYVDVFENWQLVSYACGVLDELGIDGAADQHLTVCLTIVQPRSYHADGPVRTWRINAAALRPYFNRLQSAAALAMLPDPPSFVSPECKHCNARHACPTLQRAALDACDMAGVAVPVELDAAAMGLELRMLQRASKLLDARISGLEETVLSTVRRGGAVPGFRIEHGKGRKRWNKPIAEVVTMAKLMDVDVAKSLEAITPAQAIKSGLPADLVNMFSETPQGEAKIVADDGSLARRVFG